METITRFGTWLRVMDGHAAEVVALMTALRNMIVDLDPDVPEAPRASEGTIASGPGEKTMSEAYCYLMPGGDDRCSAGRTISVGGGRRRRRRRP